MDQIIETLKKNYVDQRRVAGTINKDLDYFRLKRNYLKDKHENVKMHAIPPLIINTITILLCAILLLNIEWLSSEPVYHLFAQLSVIFLTLIGIYWVIGFSINKILTSENIDEAIQQQGLKEMRDKKIIFAENIDNAIRQQELKKMMGFNT